MRSSLAEPSEASPSFLASSMNLVASTGRQPLWFHRQTKILTSYVSGQMKLAPKQLRRTVKAPTLQTITGYPFADAQYS